MCQPIDAVLRVVNTVKAVLDGKNGVLSILIIVLVACPVGMAMVYRDFRDFLREMTMHQAAQTEVLRTIDVRLSALEHK